jgi:hypothetical protein
LRAQKQGEIQEVFLTDNNLTELKNPKIITYIGGNNEVYFDKALPAFIKFIDESIINRLDLSNLCFNFHFHPGSKKEHKDKDLILKLMEKYKTDPGFPKIFFSENLDNALILADTIFYHQTSMSPLFLLAGIKCAQVGHEAFPEILLKQDLIQSITNSEDFAQYISDLSSKTSPLPKEKIMEVLGISADGLERFADFIIKPSQPTE